MPHAYVLWSVPDGVDVDTQLAELAPLSDDEIAAALPDAPRLASPVVDDERAVTITGLADGRYYVRAALADGSSTTDLVAPFILDLPQVAPDGTLVRAVTVYPKPVEPPLPPPSGGERFVKVDKTDTPLAGAAFAVLTSPEPGTYHRVVIDNQPLLVVSGDDGTFEVTGLPYGQYFLQETKAPNGYALLTDTIPFTVDETSLDDAMIIRIVNAPLPPGTIPKTGDLSLLLSLGAGAILIGMGSYLSRKPRPHDAE